MPRPITYALLASTVALAGCTTTAGPITDTLASATLQAGDGAAHGTAALISTDGKLELRIAAQGLAAGTHGLHIHAAGICTGPDFASAGPHLNPHGKMHGTDNPQGSHLGDLPNLTVGADGAGTLTVSIEGSQAAVEPLLFDSDGAAIVIHVSADDYRTDPSGNSGGRIACGVLTRR